MRRWLRAPSVGMLLFALAGCSEDGLTRVRSALSAEPAEIDFGEGCIGAENLIPLQLRNVGQAVAIVERIEVDPPGSPFTAEPPTEALPPGGTTTVMVRFDPVTPRERSAAQLRFIADDDVEVVVPVQGVAGLRSIEAFPSPVDFGVVDEGSPSVRALEVRNVGGSPLNIREIVWTSTSADLRPLADTFRGGVIPSKGTEAFEIRYDPTDLGADRGQVVIFSDDPDQPRLEVEVRGRANLRPVLRAVGCRRPGPEGAGCAMGEGRAHVTTGIDSTIHLDVREAMDPEGDAVSFNWRYTRRPEGSIASPFPEEVPAGAASVLVDRVGDYVMEVVALDGRGLPSLPAEVTIGPRDLEVRLVWDLATDVDLHLVRPGGEVGDYGNGVPGRSQGADCSPFNRAPQWGAPDTEDDDPRLDRDAVSSPGPELAGLDAPEPGAYRVYAHYCDSRDVRASTSARVEVRSRGVLVAELGPLELNSGDLWAAGELRWNPRTSSVEVVPLTQPAPNRPGICRSRP